MNEPSDIRSPALLFKTVEYMRECIVDLDRLSDGNSPFAHKIAPNF